MKFKYPSGTLLKNIKSLSITNVDDSDTHTDNGELFLVLDVDYTDQKCTLLCQKDGMYSKWQFNDMYRGYFRKVV